MAKKGDIFLGQLADEKLLSPFGRVLTIEDEQINREGRTASARLVRDIIDTKATITLSYDLIGGSALKDLLDIYAIGEELSLLIYHTDDTGTSPEPEQNYDAYIVLMDSLTRKRELLAADGLWSDVVVTLKEV